MRKSPKIARSRRFIVAISISSLVAFILAACGGSSSGGSSGSPTSGDITWWGWTPTTQVADQYIKAFNAQYPNIHVTYKMLTIAGYNAALRPALASTVGPDIFDVAPGAANGSVETYAVDAENLQPAVVKALGSDWKSKLSPRGTSSLTVNGKLAALSVGAVYPGMLWINSNLFNQYHLTPPTTLAEWISDCAVFKAHGVGCFVQGVGQSAFNEDTLQAISDNIQPGVYAKAITGETSWTNPVIVQALTIWQQMFHNGIMEPGALGVQQYPDANNAFMSGKDAMIMMGSWYMQYSTIPGMTAAISAAGVGNPKTFTVLAIPFPDVAGTGNTGFHLYGDSDFGLAVSSKSSHKEAATTFATWLGTSKAGQQVVANALDDIAALKGIQPAWSAVPLVTPSVQQPVLSKVIQQAVNATEPRLATQSVNLQLAIGVATTTVASGTAPAKAAATLQAAAAQMPNHGAV